MVWISENAGTLVISGILAVTVILIAVKLIRDRKRGKSSCGCGCSHCAMADKCHPGDKAR